MKRLITLLLVLVMMLGVVPTYADASTDTSEFKYDLLSALSIIPSTMDKSNLGDDATRVTLAYVAAKLSGAEVHADTAVITDVSDLDIKYVKAVVENGFMTAEGGLFNPDAVITATEAKDVILKAVAGNTILTPAEQNKIFKTISTDRTGKITNKQLFKMAQNSLTINLPTTSYRDGEYAFEGVYDVENSKATVLAAKFGVSVYEGTIVSVDEKNSTATVDITKNVEESNPQMLPLGEYILKASTNVNLNHYDNAPVALWVQGEDIVYMELQEDVEIRYSYIYAVNGDTTKGNKYSTNFIENIHYYGEDEAYKINHNELRVIFNNKVTTSSVSLIGNFAKTILREEEVVSIQAWDLEHGGIVTSYDKNVLEYTHGRTNGVRIADTSIYSKVVLYTDGRSTDISELKANTLFDFYKDDNSLIIVASEKIITGTLDGITNDYIQISGTKYYRDNQMYFSTTGTAYTDMADSNEYTNLFGQQVDVYFTYNGFARYFRSSLGVPVDNGEFLAAVVKYVDNEYGDTIDEDLDMLILFTLEEPFEKVVYSVEDMDGIFQDGITPEYLSEYALDTNGQGIFKFKLNGRGNICSIRKPTYLTGIYPGFSLGDVPNSRIPTDANQSAYLYCVNSLKYPTVCYFEKTQPMAMLYTDGKYFQARTVEWGDLPGLVSANTKIHLFAKEDNTTQLDLILFAGKPTELVNTKKQQGIISAMDLGVDEDGNVGYSVTVVGSRGKRVYYVSEETVEKEGLAPNQFIIYSDDLFFSEDDIIVDQKADVSGPMTEWDLTYITTYQHYDGVIYKYEGDMIFFEDEADDGVDYGATSGTVHRNESFIIRDNGPDAGKYRFEPGIKADLLPGRNVVYTVSGSMQAIIVEAIDN